MGRVLIRRSRHAGDVPDGPQAGRLRWRCRRGMLELDLVLERFLDEHYVHLTAQQQQEFSNLLELEDHELWQRIRDAREAGSPLENMLRSCNAS